MTRLSPFALTDESVKERNVELVRDRRGAVASEYVVVLGLCAMAAAAAVAGWGPALVANYEISQGILVSPFP